MTANMLMFISPKYLQRRMLVMTRNLRQGWQSSKADRLRRIWSFHHMSHERTDDGAAPKTMMSSAVGTCLPLGACILRVCNE